MDRATTRHRAAARLLASGEHDIIEALGLDAEADRLRRAAVGRLLSALRAGQQHEPQPSSATRSPQRGR